MTLPVPPSSIDLDDVNVELPTKSSGDQVSLNDSNLRGLTPNSTYADALHGVGINTTSGSIISMYELYGASGLDTTPDQFTFNDVTGASLSTTNTSNTITISGMSSGASTAVSISGGSYSKNLGSYTTSAGTAQNGDTFSVQITSSGSYSTTVNSTLTVGGVSDTYSVTTQAAPSSPSWSWTTVPSTVTEGTAYSVSFADSNNIASGSFSWSITTPQTASGVDWTATSGSGTLNSSSQGSFSITATADGVLEGTEYSTLRVYYNSTNILSQQINIADYCPPAGQTVGGQYCIGYDLYQDYTDGNCGTTSSLVQANSASCGYCPPAGQLQSTFCGNGSNGTLYSLYGIYTDGNCGTYTSLIAARSSSCGYSAPSISVSGFNNGAVQNTSWNKQLTSANSLTVVSGTATASASVASGLTPSYQWSLVSYSQATGDATLTSSSFSSGQSSSTTGSITGYPNAYTGTFGVYYYTSETVSVTIRCTVSDGIGGSASADISNVMSFYWQG